jgi:copper chaperone NosL
MAWLVLVALISSAACNSGPELDEPPEIRYGEDTCSRCLMIINEARDAASYVTGTGEVRYFDDLGEMFSYVSETPENVVVFWVHDYDTEAWVKGREAHYVAADGLRTPMGFDIVAFSTRVRAESLTAEMDGTIYSFDSLMALAISGEIELAHEHDE